jgi:hypothetical protein
MAAGETSILVLSLDAPGKVTPVQQFNFAADAKNNGVSIGGLVLTLLSHVQVLTKSLRVNQPARHGRVYSQVEK